MKQTLIFFTLFLVLGSTSSIALEGTPFTLKLGTRLQYNDNLFLETGNKNSDMLFSILPAVIFDMVTRPADIQIEYDPEIVIPIWNFDNNDARRILHRGKLVIESELNHGLTLTLKDEAIMLPDNFGRPENNTSTLVQSNYATLQASQLIELGGRTDMTFEPRVGRFDASAPGADRTDFSVFLSVARQLHPSLTLGVSGVGYRQLYDDDLVSDLWRFGYRGDVAFEATARLTLKASAGQQWLVFEGGTTESDLTISGGLVFEYMEGESIEVDYQQGFLTNAGGEPFGVQTIVARGAYPLTGSLRAGVEVSHGWYRQVINDAALGTVGSQETDTLLSVRPSIWYNFSERLVADAGYSISLNRGAISANDFNSNIAFVGISYATK